MAETACLMISAQLTLFSAVSGCVRLHLRLGLPIAQQHDSTSHTSFQATWTRFCVVSSPASYRSALRDVAAWSLFLSAFGVEWRILAVGFCLVRVDMMLQVLRVKRMSCLICNFTFQPTLLTSFNIYTGGVQNLKGESKRRARSRHILIYLTSR